MVVIKGQTVVRALEKLHILLKIFQVQLLFRFDELDSVRLNSVQMSTCFVKGLDLLLGKLHPTKQLIELGFVCLQLDIMFVSDLGKLVCGPCQPIKSCYLPFF